MKNMIILGVVGAVMTGLMIGLQSSLSNRTGQLIGSLRTGLLTNIFGGGVALLVFILAIAAKQLGWELPPRQALIMLLSSGALGVFIIIGISFSLRYTGVVAGLGSVILGQMLISSVVDAIGWLGLQRVPFTWQRGAGLLLLAAAIYMLLPRN